MCYASRHCSHAESKLGPTDGELLAMVYACEKFHSYIAGSHFTLITDHAALVTINESRTKNAKLARWAMRLANYDFTIKHRAGRVHNNADGLSRARAAPAPDTPAPDACLIEELVVNEGLLTAALHCLETDRHIDGDPHPPLPADESPIPEQLLGPRQLLLEAAPCTACNQHLPPDAPNTLVCDRCNAPFHLRCTSLTHVPPTSWYCKTCTRHIHARGIQCPTEDVELQRYLLDGTCTPTLKQAFSQQARHLSYTHCLHSWRDGKWVPYPTTGLRTLLMEEVHTRHHHIGGEKMCRLLQASCWWPTMLADCRKFVQTCFECQVSSGRVHGTWMGVIQPLPPGPRHTWQMDFITGVGPSGGPSHHILTLIDTFSKYCILTLTKDRKSSTVASILATKLFAYFGNPTCIQCDNGTEFKGAVASLCASRNIHLQRSLPYSSHV